MILYDLQNKYDKIIIKSNIYESVLKFYNYTIN